MDNFDLKKYLVENKVTTQSSLNEDENISEVIIDKIKSLTQRTPDETGLINSLDMFSDQLLFPGKEKYDTVIKKAKKFGMNIDKEQASNIIQKVIDKKLEDLEKQF